MAERGLGGDTVVWVLLGSGLGLGVSGMDLGSLYHRHPNGASLARAGWP
ncbi:protein of unknown function (plasmid) [Vibrio tapetis subsp. tapetis]|uniref:Uncharacterized protein n=1 Tax=Vibrio tapetis subsp. tapetis TaxID=1671868 RepID=A0A2N8ZNN3_9VIBR|nr:protein of unknown function [Vibrio tapetis subsp. tapetis]